MFVKTLDDIINTPSHVSGEAFDSHRLLLARDGLGYSFHDTRIAAGTTQHLHYKNHIETNYCVAGQGSVEEVATGKVWPIAPGTLFVLDQHDAHIVRADTDIHLICVFTPALTGQETHDKDGSYSAAET
ncbi:MAG: ectoine synthase [Pseudomonadota bacterium]